MLFVVMFALSAPVCPDWISDDSLVTAPQGVELSQEQQIRNQLRCFTSIILPWERACRQQRPPSYCKAKTNLWIRNNFSWQGQPTLPCANGGKVRKTLMLNIRSTR